MPAKRPFFLNLLIIRLPVGGMVSILHRVTGAALSVAVPFLIYLLGRSLRSAEDFHAVADWFGTPLGWLILAGLTWITLHHFFAGLRHLGFDLGWGEDREPARLTAWLTLTLGIGLTLLVAIGRLI